MLKAEKGATMETDLEETPRGRVLATLSSARTSGSSSRGRSLRARPMPSPGSRRRLPLRVSSTRLGT